MESRGQLYTYDSYARPAPELSKNDAKLLHDLKNDRCSRQPRFIHGGTLGISGLAA